MVDPKSEIGLLQAQLMSMMSAINGLKARGMDAGGADGPPPTEILGAGGEVTVDGLDLSAFSFGCGFSGRAVTVYDGYIRRGFREKYFVEGATFNLSAHLNWSYLNYDLNAGTATLVTNASSVPDDTLGTMYIPLHQYSLISGIAWICSGGVHHIGDIFLPGETA